MKEYSIPQYNIPQRTKEAIDRYVQHHIFPGDFLYAVLTNNLRESFARADMENLGCLYEIVKYCYWEIPGVCWESEEKVDKWLESGAK